MTETEMIVSSPTGDPDQVTLFVGGTALTGWTDIAITRRSEGCPNSFEVAVTSRDPKTGAVTAALAGDSCEVEIGNDRVITGYVDRNLNAGSASDHTLRIIGRGKCADLVDCSAEWLSGQILGSNVLEVSQKLAAAYGIEVAIAGGIDPGPVVPQLNLNYGETAYAIIERLTRAAGLLAYEDAQGRLVLTRAGSTTAASGIAYGQNVERWETVNAMDARYSEIVCVRSGVNNMGDLGEAGFAFDTERDPNVKRHRLLYLVMEPTAEDPAGFVERRARWEIARRAGRGRQVRVTVDSWRDSAGNLWEPNTLAPIDVPGLAATDRLLVISEVTYLRDSEAGTTAELLLMPREAFLPEPIVLMPVNLADVVPLPPTN